MARRQEPADVRSPRVPVEAAAHPVHSPALPLLAALAASLVVSPVAGQESGSLEGVVRSARTGEGLEGATVRLRGTDAGAFTGAGGRFRIPTAPVGTHVLEASAAGHRTATRQVSVGRGETVEVRIDLSPSPLELQGIEVSVLRPDLRPEAGLEAREVREANPNDSGELLRELPGVDAVRRGALGLDPSVRGLRESEVGTYVDGSRMFPAGPARMDSPLSHLDPSAVSDVQVVKGPYALTWGAGNLSAIRVQTRRLPETEETAGRLTAGFDSNREAAETTGTLAGRSGDVAYWLHGAWRDGDDYESGGDPGLTVPGDYRSREGRGKIGVDVSGSSQLVVSGGYQDQGPVDYPGRLLTARLFETLNLIGRWTMEKDRGALRSLEVMGYVNDVHHEMDNSGKPTARAMPGRTPPFALDVFVDSDVSVHGGRADAQLTVSDAWELEVGGDVYSAHRAAVRSIRRASDGRLLFEDLMWPEATITDAGVFTRATRELGERVTASGTVRLDLVEATADTASTFFRENTAGDPDADEVNLSGALTVGVDLSPHWTLSGGLGSAVRTADATERYSDRIPATKAQTSAEFMGDPDLDPERSSQADLWLEGSYERLSVSANAFGRTLDDYITLKPTDLPVRLPLSPDTVFRYVNGEATFWGFETSAALRLGEAFTLRASTAYLWGEDDRLDEPALGVHPWRGSLGVRYDHPAGRFYAEIGATGVADMDRDDVALGRGETPTPGYVTGEFRGGVQIGSGLDLRVGIENLADEDYVNHLNARNPFSGDRIPEPGRVFFADLSWEF